MSILAGVIRAFYRGVAWLSYQLGDRRRFLRRVAGTCLVVLGVHAAAECTSDVLFAAVDRLDAWVDAAVSWVCGFLGAEGYGESFAALVGPEQKETISVVLALLLELWMVGKLLGFAWGSRREQPQADSSRPENKKPIPADLESLVIGPVMLAFACCGVVLAARATEAAVASGLGGISSLPDRSAALGAMAAMISAMLLLWRFVPVLVRGAIQRARERALFAWVGDMSLAATRDAREAARPSRLRRGWQALSLGIRHFSRGLSLALLILPTAVLGILSIASFWRVLLRMGGLI